MDVIALGLESTDTQVRSSWRDGEGDRGASARRAGGSARAGAAGDRRRGPRFAQIRVRGSLSRSVATGRRGGAHRADRLRRGFAAWRARPPRCAPRPTALRASWRRGAATSGWVPSGFDGRPTRFPRVCATRSSWGRSCSSMAKRWSRTAARTKPSGCWRRPAQRSPSCERSRGSSESGGLGAQRGARLVTLALTSRSDDPAQCRLCRRTILNRNLAGVGSLWPLATARTLNL